MDRAPSSDGSSHGSFSHDHEYDLNLDFALKEIQKRRAGSVGLQAPEGLKRALPGIARHIEEKTGTEVMISGDPCYGACDVDAQLCQEVDLMLHLGHADLGAGQKNVLFLEARRRDDLRDVTHRALPLLKEKRVGVATTIQHVGQIEGALEVLKQHGIVGVLGPAGGRVKYPGQVLGCCYSSARLSDAEEYLFIGTGRFHPLGIALATGKRVIAADPVTGEIVEIDPDPMLRRRFGAIARAADSKRFAVLVSKKPGQRRIGLARRLKAMGEEKGREMFLVYIDNIEPDRLLNLGAEAAVSTACPRIALDDAAKYRIPILTPPEFEVLVGVRLWEECGFDEIEQTD
ncbi:MAG: 2-(3-amino-3-carboxypropyl)histidine synthase [Methanosaeta sp. PtaU1.Bin060]|nr:MAG: 2-(3-amino-3-carboxypropyl)histidine synthase [Methanosaeta sp. PtaU1.Bin060]